MRYLTGQENKLQVYINNIASRMVSPTTVMCVCDCPAFILLLHSRFLFMAFSHTEALVAFKGIVESSKHSSKLWQPLACHLGVNSVHMVRIR